MGGAPGTSTQWPSGLTIAASWDRQLAEAWGKAMGKEFRDKGANVQLGPGLNVARVPGGGRNFEYMSGEDPLLGAQLASQTIRGIQSNGVIATAKHFILNNQEDQRGNMSSNIDERTLMEIYYPPFKAAIDAGVGSFMCGYNRINGTWACEQERTLQLLRKNGFKGFVMSDWGGTHSTVKAALAGLDQEMPGGGFFTQEKLGGAVANGTLSESDIDDMATHVLTAMYAVGVMDIPQPTGHPSANVTTDDHAALAQAIAEQSSVLLKNDEGILPLDSGSKVAVIGAAANCTAPTPKFGFGWPETIGCMNSGGGSGGVAPSHVVSILSAVQEQASSVNYANGSDTKAAAALAKEADVAIVVVGVTSSEGTDRTDLNLPADQLAYLRAVAAAQPRTVVVVMTPGSLVMDWAANVQGILCAFLPGQAQGAAVANILYGKVNPSGRLPVTMPTKQNEPEFTDDQYPGIAFADGLQTNYSEKLEIGYRWYMAHKVKPAFLFGDGLSYTSFKYSNLKVSRHAHSQVLRVNISNVGLRDGEEVVQLYLTFPDAAKEPPLQLRGFNKVFIAAGASRELTFELAAQDLSIWNEKEHKWSEQKGSFDVAVGGSLSHLEVSTSFSNRPKSVYV